MNKSVLIGGGLLVAALLAGLLYAMSRPAAPASGPGAAKAPDTKDEPRKAPRRDGAGAPDEPVPDDVPDPLASGPDGGRGPRQDHRNDGEAAAPPAITPATISAIRAVVAPLVKQCAASLRQANPPQKGRIFVNFNARSAGGRVFVENAAIRQIEIESAELVDCVEKAFESTVIDAPEGQADGERVIAMQFNVP